MIDAVDHEDFKQKYNELISKFGYTLGLSEKDDFIMVQYPNEEILRLHVSKIKSNFIKLKVPRLIVEKTTIRLDTKNWDITVTYPKFFNKILKKFVKVRY